MEQEANLCLLTGQWSKGAKLFTRLLSLESLHNAQTVAYLLKRSECYIQLGEYSSAVTDSSFVIQLLKEKQVVHSGNTARSNLVQALFMLHQYSEAEFALREWLALLDKSADAPKLLERLHLAMQGVQNSMLLRNELSTITDPKVTDKNYTVVCVYCNVKFNSKNELRGHCQTEEHQQVVMSDEGRDWEWRPPPRGCDYVECTQWKESETCRLGNTCLYAHGSNELDEWNERLKYRQMKLQRACDAQLFGHSYTYQLLERLKKVSNTRTILKTTIDNVIDTCSSNLTTTLISKPSSKELTFTLATSLQLRAVALLHDAHRTYFEIHQITSESKTFDLPNKQEWLCDTANCTSNIQVRIKFSTDVYGTFRQSLVFDFGSDAILSKDICIDVVPDLTFAQMETIQDEVEVVSKMLWTKDNTVMIPFKTTDASYNESCDTESVWTKLYPLKTKFKLTSDVLEKHLCQMKYRARMHTLLYMEEIDQVLQIRKFNIKAQLHIVDSYMLASAVPSAIAKYSNFGELYAYMNLPCDISEDSSCGRLLLNSCNSVFLSVQKTHVYEAVIENKGKNVMYLRLSAKCVKRLDLNPNTTVTVYVQFRLHRAPFCMRHYAVDNLHNLALVFPEKHLEPLIPWSPEKQWSDQVDSRLNIKQKEALIAITTPIFIPLPPILLIGPFGTGKTFTFAQAVKEILKQDGTKVLICTHSNSAADIYIKDYFHEYYEAGNLEARPLRIYYQKRWVFSVHPIVQRYCLIKETPTSRTFQAPTLGDIKEHRIVVVTLATSMYLYDLGLPQGYFTHILLDEAAQTIECEAIIPLCMATPNTRIVLAGDHMQLSPEIYSKFARDHNFHVSLLERLYDHYPGTFPCKILLSENYRAHEAIIDFTSEMFYEQKLVASGKQAKHPKWYPLTFFTVKGEDVQDINSTAFYNIYESYEIVERVVELKNNWPATWGNFNEHSIGILAPYSDQVFRIRYQLRKRSLSKISTERVLNVQGKQFRAIFLSIVRTRQTCKDKDTNTDSDYGFLSDTKLLNTAITRAQSLVVVVGDPVAMCTIGRCSKIWEKFLKTCCENNSLNGITWASLKFQLDGIELKKIYGLNPLAPEFIPRSQKVVEKLEEVPKSQRTLVQEPALSYAQPQEETLSTVYVGPAPPPPTYAMLSPEGDLVQLLDKVHVPNGHSIHDCMNLLPQNMPLANVLMQPPWFHLQWYDYLLNSKGAEAAKRYKYLISVSTKAPEIATSYVPYINPQVMYPHASNVNQINFSVPYVYNGTSMYVPQSCNDQRQSTRLYERQSTFNNNKGDV